MMKQDQEATHVERGTLPSLAHDVEDVHICRTDDILLSENVDFKSLLLPDNILHGLNVAHFRRPSPIQLRAIPLLRLGLDLIVQAKSGTGKTLVIALAALETVKVELRKVQVVVIAPTREIALQIKDFINAISSGFEGLKVEAFVGGLPIAEDKKSLIGCHIAVGTPGRLQDLVKSKFMHLKWVQLLVLDEADKLMENELFKQVKCICKELGTNKQTILCSATFQNPLQEYVASQMKDPFWVSSEGASRLRGGKLQPHNSVPMVLLGIRHFLKEVPHCSNVTKLLHLKLEEILSILSNVSFSQCLIFSNYQSIAETICNLLVTKGWPAKSIRGQDSQLQRMAAISALRELRCRVLLSTDVTSRGIDIKGVDLVINLDIPHNSATYLHRTGRAGRFGSLGSVITLASKGKELKAFQKIIADIPNVVIFKLPDNMQISGLDNAFQRLSFGAEEEFSSHQENLENANTTTVANSSEQNQEISAAIMNAQAKGKQALRDAKSLLAATLLKRKSFGKCSFSSYDELENKFQTWKSNATLASPSMPILNEIVRHDWWTSAEMILFEADRELQQIIEERFQPEKETSKCKILKYDQKCVSRDERCGTSHQFPKHKKEPWRSKQEMNEQKNYQTEESINAEWDWDSDWNLYYTWDPSSKRCYFFNPWTKVYYKWECDTYYKWNEQFQFYEAWDPNSNSFLECTEDISQLKQYQCKETYSAISHNYLNSNWNPHWNWFMTWNNQIKQMCTYIKYLDYLHSICHNRAA